MGRLSHLFGIVRRTQLHPSIWLWRSGILDVNWQSHTDRRPHLIHLHRHGGWKPQTRRLWLSILEDSGSFHHQVSRRRSRSISRISLLFVSSRFCGCGTRVCLHDCWRGEKSTMCKPNEKRSCLGTMLSQGHFLWVFFFWFAGRESTSSSSQSVSFHLLAIDDFLRTRKSLGRHQRAV